VTPTLGAASSYRTETRSKPIKARWYLIQVSNARRLLKLTTLAELVHFPKAKKGPQTYWVTLRATSIEDDRPPSTYKIVWDGKWEDGDSEMRNHVSVEKA
jgi:hypothetical protein